MQAHHYMELWEQLSSARTVADVNEAVQAYSMKRQNKKQHV